MSTESVQSLTGFHSGYKSFLLGHPRCCHWERYSVAVCRTEEFTEPAGSVLCAKSTNLLANSIVVLPVQCDDVVAPEMQMIDQKKGTGYHQQREKQTFCFLFIISSSG